jgi:hypothetical protein
MSLKRSLTKLGALFRKDAIDCELDAEIRSHLAMEVEENVENGMDPEQARRAAQRAFGHVGLAKDDSRSAWIYRWIEDLGKDLRFGVRMLVKNRGFSAIAILSLALGFGLNTTIFTVVNAILLNPLPVRDVGRLVSLDNIDTKTKFTQAHSEKLGMSFPNYQDFRRQNEVFTDLAAWQQIPLTWSGGAEPRQVQGDIVSANYFDVLGIKPAAAFLSCG